MAKHKKASKKSKSFLKKFFHIFKKPTALGALAIIIIAGIFGWVFFIKQDIIMPRVLDVSISSATASQADTLSVVVKNEAGEISGTFGLRQLYFFRHNDDWVSFVPVPVNYEPGNYILRINASDNALFEKNIEVIGKYFPTTVLNVTPKLVAQGYTPEKIVTTIVNKENVELNEVLNIITPTPYFTKPFSDPLVTMKVVGNYGDMRASGNYKIQHLGVDLKAPLWTSVYAVNDGKVVFKEKLPNYGNMLIIDHGLGIYSLYLHLSEFKVSVGQMVKQDNLIALSGNTGYVLGPHLHFSMKLQGASINPLEFIKATQENW